MPITRLASISRPRSGSRPPRSLEKKRSAREASVSLADLQEWEPSSDEPVLDIDEVTKLIAEWSEELTSKGRAISGKTMFVRSLPPRFHSFGRLTRVWTCLSLTAWSSTRYLVSRPVAAVISVGQPLILWPNSPPLRRLHAAPNVVIPLDFV